MVIHLDEYRKAKRPCYTGIAAQDDERLCVNGNPAFRVIALSFFQRPLELSPILPDDIAALEPAFLERVHALASQI